MSKSKDKNKQNKGIAPSTNPINSDEKITAMAKAFLNNIKEYKEAYILLSTAIGLVIGTFFNLSCDMIYRGYADSFHIDIQYVQRDNHDLFVSILIILGTGIMCMPIFVFIYQLASKLSRYKFKQCIPIIISAVLIFLPIALAVIHQVFSVKDDWTWILLATVLIAMFALVFITIYLAALYSVHRQHRSITSNTNLAEAQDNEENTNNNNHTQGRHWINLIKSIPLLVISLICALFAEYWFGRAYVSCLTEFDFMVTDSLSELVDVEKPPCNLILSQTDEYYYLSAYEITNQNGLYKITIYPDYHILLQKSDDLNSVSIVRNHFAQAEVKTGLPKT